MILISILIIIIKNIIVFLITIIIIIVIIIIIDGIIIIMNIFITIVIVVNNYCELSLIFLPTEPLNCNQAQIKLSTEKKIKWRKKCNEKSEKKDKREE